ncbi:hypothetical protein DFAR_1720006 [Desulfarculales bacterium]
MERGRSSPDGDHRPFREEGRKAEDIDSFVELDGRSNLSDLGAAMTHFIMGWEGVA